MGSRRLSVGDRRGSHRTVSVPGKTLPFPRQTHGPSGTLLQPSSSSPTSSGGPRPSLSGSPPPSGGWARRVGWVGVDVRKVPSTLQQRKGVKGLQPSRPTKRPSYG